MNKPNQQAPGDVKWVTGRQHALARSIAILLNERTGDRQWTALPQATRDRAVQAADLLVQGWVRDKVLAGFLHPYADADDHS